MEAPVWGLLGLVVCVLLAWRLNQSPAAQSSGVYSTSRRQPVIEPTYGRCMGPNCKFWAGLCKSAYCQPCCEKIHNGSVWSWHPRPDGSVYRFIQSPTSVGPSSPHSMLPVHYGGHDAKGEIEDPAPPVVGAIEDVTDEGKVIVPVKDNSYFAPRGGASGFPVQYDK